ncbi:MAG: hypothetical protein A2Y62_18740 [Candidatus Fischerbacteria bacterium RBG_13_37_8]|uniref:Nudix hydrolase domain-containing protein n=1 Tax=Candidatus Fischerbacteria bacterium RBG_13_37_8 TaxID=1817863 RepID=A0A1F5VQ04_9BACT|nr:MAG: hypothetical protein A2Y62_18740 [Candidatus Fischerbacteria bacterium RBG_13_37_8]
MKHNFKLSSVLVPLVKKNKQYAILFIKRTNLVRHHKGEVSFPGGLLEKTDKNLKETVFREVHEELGLSDKYIEIIGVLDDAITVTTNYLVRPYVGFLKNIDQLNPNAFEVADIIYVPVSALLNQKVHQEIIFINNAPKILYTYFYDKISIWGATARILHNFITLLSSSLSRLT